MPRNSWYPSFDPSVPFSVQSAIKTAFDWIYQQRDSLNPITLQGRGMQVQTISDTPIAVDGCNITLPRGGTWLVTGNFTFNVIGDTGQLFSGVVVKRGTPVLVQAQLEVGSDTTATVSQQWLIPASQGEVLGLSVVKAGGGGTSTVDGLHTTITAVWAGE